MNVPDGWESNKLGAICRIKKGIQFNRIELSDAGMYPCINGGITPSGYSDLWNTEAETITISEGGNSCGFVNYLTSKFWSGGHCYSLLDLKKGLDRGFLYQALKGQESLIMDLRVGSGLPNIQQKAIKEFELLVPESASEQRQIGRILSKVDEAISQTEQLIAKYRRLKTGLMQDLLTKGINGSDNNQLVSQLKGIIINSDFIQTTFRSVSKVRQGYQIAISNRKQEEGPNRLVYVTVQYLNNPKKYSEYIENPPEGVICEKDDILFTRTGNTGQIVTNIKGVFHNNFFKVSFDKEKVTKDYLVAYLNWNPIQDLIKELAGTTTIPDMKHGDFYEMPVFYPKDLNEQVKASNALKSASDYLDALHSDLVKLQSLKTGLMQDLLSGKVRVGQFIRETADA